MLNTIKISYKITGNLIRKLNKNNKRNSLFDQKKKRQKISWQILCVNMRNIMTSINYHQRNENIN